MAQRSRVVAVVALLIVLAAALRGYLPGGETPQQDRPTSGLGSLFAVVAMLTVSMAIIAIAIITQARRRAPSSAGGPPRRELAGERRPVTWKMVLVGVGVLAAWLLLIALLSRWNLPIGVDQPAQNAATTPPTAGPQPPNRLDGPASGANVVPVLATAALLLLMLLVAAAVIGGRRRRPAAADTTWSDDEPARAPAAGPDPLTRAAEVGLAEMGDRTREPREAIIACYAAMERELENSPRVVPRESDTPSEVLARAVEHRALRADSAIELVELFEEARFSPHVMTEQHRDAALRVLSLVLSELRSVP